jgi:N-methylhydantoinase A
MAAETVQPHQLALAADVGGTFTDFVAVDRSTGVPRTLKILTTPDDPSQAVTEGTRQCLEGAAGGQFEQFVHGTTLVINALVERKGASTALITTDGIRDILEMRRENRHDVYDLAQPYPEPLIPRLLRAGIPERVLASGHVLQTLDEEAVHACICRLRQLGVESVAVGFMHSYKNPIHEQRVAALLAEHWPDVFVSLSAEVNPEQGEYERFSTTAANAYVKPLMRSYLLNLDRKLRGMALSQPFMIFSSHGGVVPVETAAELPVFMVESGPAGGASAAAHIASALGIENVLAVDIGGTTAKMCGIRDGQVITRHDYEVARVSRFSPGSGLPLRIPVVDIIEIGAGGGSIARVDEFGLIAVGPESAGADPGPACYNRGGSLPTVTDADVVLGRVSPDSFLGGGMPLNAAAAQEAIERGIGDPLGLDLREAAMGISEVVDESMAITASEYLREHGIDPRHISMVAYGGMGPVHAASLAERMGVPEVLVPPFAGVFSALGFLVAPRSLELTQTCHEFVGTCNYDHLVHLATELADRARTLMRASPSANTELVFGMRYRGQWQPIDVPLPSPAAVCWTAQLFRDQFVKAYARLYEQISEDIPIEIVTLRARIIEPSGILDINQIPNDSMENLTVAGERAVSHATGLGQIETVPTPIVLRRDLPADFAGSGPMLIVEEQTTTVVPRNWLVEVVALGVLRLRRR